MQYYHILVFCAKKNEVIGLTEIHRQYRDIIANINKFQYISNCLGIQTQDSQLLLHLSLSNIAFRC